MLDNGTVSLMLKKMQQAGYVEKKRSEEDDRVVIITITDRGRVLQEKAKEVPEKVVQCIDLEPEKVQNLYSLLYEIIDNSGKSRYPGG